MRATPGLEHSSRANADLDKLRDALLGVSGYFSLDEAWALNRAVRDSQGSDPLRVVEIGSYKGKSTIAICLALSERGSGTCISIDPHSPTGKASYVREHGTEDTFEEYRANIDRAGVSSFAKPVRATSSTAVGVYDGAPIDILFIDGSHDYDDVKLDIALWTPFLREKSLLAFNDPYAPGVNRAIRQFLSQTKPRRPCSAYHVNNTLFLVLGIEPSKASRPLTLAAYLFIERQSFKLLKLTLKGLCETVGLVYRKPLFHD